jgi:hypothetical protein
LETGANNVSLTAHLIAMRVAKGEQVNVTNATLGTGAKHATTHVEKTVHCVKETTARVINATMDCGAKIVPVTAALTTVSNVK